MEESIHSRMKWIENCTINELTGQRVAYEASLSSLPDGCFVQMDAFSYLVRGDALLLWSPAGYMEKQWPEKWTKHQEKGFAPTTGRVIDHVGLSVDNLDETITRLKSEGVTVIGKPTKFRETSQRAIMIEGPDHLSIQLVEGHAKKE